MVDLIMAFNRFPDVYAPSRQRTDPGESHAFCWKNRAAELYAPPVNHLRRSRCPSAQERPIDYHRYTNRLIRQRQLRGRV